MVDPTNGPDAQSPWSHIWRRALRLLLPRQAGPAGCRDCGIPHRRGAADQPRRPQAEPLRRDRCRLRQISRYPLRYERQYRPEYLKYPEYLLAFSVLLLTPTFAAAANQDASPAPTDCPATSVEENIALVEEAQAAVASADADAIDRILADTYTYNQNRYGLPDDPTSNIAQYPRRRVGSACRAGRVRTAANHGSHSRGTGAQVRKPAFDSGRWGTIHRPESSMPPAIPYRFTMSVRRPHKPSDALEIRGRVTGPDLQLHQHAVRRGPPGYQGNEDLVDASWISRRTPCAGRHWSWGTMPGSDAITNWDRH